MSRDPKNVGPLLVLETKRQTNPFPKLVEKPTGNPKPQENQKDPER